MTNMEATLETPVGADRATDPSPIEPDLCLDIADLLSRAAGRLHRGTAEAVAPLGLSHGQARVVRMLAGGSLRMTAIAARLSVVPRTVTDLVDGLEAAGIVTRQADPTDRRSTIISLTPDGSRLVERLDRVRRRSADEMFGSLSPADRASLHGVLRRLVDHPSGGSWGGSGGSWAAGRGSDAVASDGRPRP